MTGLGLAFLGCFVGAGLVIFGWFLHRAAGVVSEALIEASQRFTSEMRFRTEAGAGLLQPPDPPEKDTPEDLARFRAWLASQDDLSEQESDDLDARAQIVLGMRSAPKSTVDMYRESLLALGAPVFGAGA